MVSTPTTRNRLEKIGPGEQLNVWGGPNGLNRVIDLLDAALDGWLTVSATTTLTSANYIADQSRLRVIKYTGATSGTITVPSVEKWYIVKAVSADVTITTGGMTNATVKAGDTAIVICDAANCYKMQSNDFGGSEIVNIATPTTNTSATTKAYVDGIAFETSGVLPGQNPGTEFEAVFSDGEDAAWHRALPVNMTAGQFLQSTGTDGFPEITSAWAWDGYQGRQIETGAFTFTNTRRGLLLLCNGTFTVSLDAVATLGPKAHARLVNVGTGLITVDPSGSETVTMAGQSAKSQVVLVPGEGVDLLSDGVSTWYGILAQSAGAGPHFQAYETGAPGYADNTWVTRLISNIARNAIGASYSGGNIVGVPPGLYKATFVAMASGTTFVGRVYDVTSASQLVLGPIGSSTAFNPSTTTGGTNYGEGFFSLSATSTIAFQNFATETSANGGNWISGSGTGSVAVGPSLWLTRISP